MRYGPEHDSENSYSVLKNRYRDSRVNKWGL